MDDKEIRTFIKGKNVDILPVNMDHLKLYQKWENDPKVRVYSRNVVPKTVEDLKKRLEPSKEKWKDMIWFEIYYKPENKPIGTCEVSEINWFNRTAGLGILLGEQGLWGKSICTEVISLLSEYAFNELNMRKIYAWIFSPNTSSWRCAEKSGFTREAILKEHIYIDGKHEDTLIYSLFKKDWIRNKQ